jgi:hypothetical protein
MLQPDLSGQDLENKTASFKSLVSDLRLLVSLVSARRDLLNFSIISATPFRRI